jgi:ADP-ribose pyrophosphatase
MKKKIPDHAQCVFKGVLFDIYQWQQEMFDGSFATFEVIKRNTSVTMIPITKEGKIIVNNEEQPNKEPFISFPGGCPEDDESLLECAKRELLEETGYISNSWQEWMLSDVLKTSKIDWYNQFYIVRGCEKVADLALDAGEKIESMLVSFQDFVEKSQREDFRNLEIKNIIKEIKDDPEKLEDFRKEIFGE